jgi:ABC-type Fe3+/spermidine/putrescine transport system ATPase subunit
MLEVDAVSKALGGHLAVAEVSFSLPAGQVLALLGPSGSGKSTLLGLIAGLEAPDAGDLRWDGRSLRDTPAHARGFGLMFQDYALFPHLNVAGNVAFGLRMQGRPREETAERVHEALGLVGLAGFEGRDVNTLSGGEQQRVALARALAPRPRLLMLDEPLGALDRGLRERLLDDLRRILRDLALTAIYVTHDQEEAFALAGQVLILRAGRVVQAGAPAEVYARPASRWVAEFLGHKNLLAARLEARAGALVAVTAAGLLPLRGEGGAGQGVHSPAGPRGQANAPAGGGAEVCLMLRPDGLGVVASGAGDLEGVVTDQSFRGSRGVLVVQAGQAQLTVETPAAQPLPQPGEAVGLRLGPDAVQVMAWDSNR